MEDLSTQELRALVQRHAPEVFRDNASAQDRFILMLMAGIMGYTVGALLGALLAPAALWPTIALCTIAGPLVVRVRTGPNPQPSRVSMYSALGAAFRRQIERRRAELLGPRSEAGMA
ncbi:MAG: hypothetical protein LJF04_11705, partial [Gemmatimonadetes bacterium]|nr:hypothetical protein [Gemmatimonadota bacterium]